MRALLLPATLLVLATCSLLIGARPLPLAELFAGDGLLTLTASRLPRLAAVLLTGAGLAVAGVILQQIV
ncbi:TPA: iron chelate uptake ABC transporter family permease subunit, partial [Aeromonas dhakensis]|nr:iron chelate uptake ABC transporter family permease subunit [Aeromonas dhakensis]HDX8460319.1 iron chelate uptake ABC transporter family permease subunit [Aeromonas dhakensis]HDX9004591.1 iron chelate uptake ABC transporter family permease subunit [Aeromonas dhakensis]